MTTQWSPDIYAKAWHFATKYHAGQTYGSAEVGVRVPYLNHIGSVAMEVVAALCGMPAFSPSNANLAIQCALLHDTIEDTPVTYDMLVHEFGSDVADGVLALTKNETLPTKAAQMTDSLHRIRQQPQAVWMVKMADRITNLAPPPYYWTTEKIETYRAEAIQIYQMLHSANHTLADRLQAKIATYGRDS